MNPRIAAAGAALAVFAAAKAMGAPAPTPAPAAPPAPSAAATPMALTLGQAESIALAASPALALARGQLASAEAAMGVARSGELPDLSGAASSSRSKTVSVLPAGAFGPGSPSTTIVNVNTSKNASLTLRQLIVDGGRIAAAVQSARFSTDASRYSLERQIQSVEFGVAQSYYAALQARHQLQVAQDSLRLAQVQTQLVNAQYRAGVASRADVITAQLPVAQAQLAVAQAANGEQTQIALLLDTMGLSAQTPVSISDEAASTLALPSLDDVLAMATRDRPDLLAAQSTVDAATANLRSARLGLFPTLSASGTTATSASTSGSGNYNPNWSTTFSVSVPIFDGGLTRAQTQAAQAQLDQANADLKTTQLLVSLNVQQAYLGLQTAQAGLSAANVEYSQAKTVLDVTNAQYRAGVTTLPLLLNAQVGLTKAEGDQATALYTYKTAWQQLLLAEGIIGH